MHYCGYVPVQHNFTHTRLAPGLAPDLVTLPLQGATVLDFAYHVHTDVGNQMIGAKVNGKYVMPSHQLANAEIVDILTYDGPLTKNLVARHQVCSPHTLVPRPADTALLLTFKRAGRLLQKKQQQNVAPSTP